MLRPFKSNVIFPLFPTIKPIPPKNIKITYNNEKCYKCDKRNTFPVTNDGGSASQCVNCGTKLVLFSYIDEDTYKKIIKEKFNEIENNINKDSFNSFITKYK